MNLKIIFNYTTHTKKNIYVDTYHVRFGGCGDVLINRSVCGDTKIMVNVVNVIMEDMKMVRTGDVETMLVEVAEMMAAMIEMKKLNPTSFVTQYHDATKHNDFVCTKYNILLSGINSYKKIILCSIK